MQVFNCKVRLAGSLLNEVVKRGVTVPEIHVLRRIHGDDGIVNIEHVGDTEIDDIDERGRLHEEYAGGLASLGDEHKTSIEKMFGGDYNALPKKLRDYEGKIVDRFDDLDIYMEPADYIQKDISSKYGRKAMKEKRDKVSSAAMAAAVNKTAKGEKKAAVV